MSPVLIDRKRWLATLTTVWNTVQWYFETGPNITCGTHIHIRPADQEFSLAELKAIWKGVIYYGNVLAYLEPRATNTNKWASHNASTPAVARICPELKGQWRTSEVVKSKRMATVFKFIDGHQSKSVLVNAASPTKAFQWNFQPVLDSRKTIESRMARQVRSAEEAVAWIARTNAFISACCRKDWKNVGLKARGGINGGAKYSDRGPRWFELCHDLQDAAKIMGINHLIRLADFQ